MSDDEPIVWGITQEDIDCDRACHEHGRMLVHLLVNDVLFVGSSNGMMQARNGIVSIHVICSDTFGYACADCEDLLYVEIPKLYDLWLKDRAWGPTAWVIARRKMMPIGQVADGLAKQGFDVAALVRGELP